MNKKIEEMIALGAAYALNCEFCIEYHRKKAIDAGLTQDEMLAAVQVAEDVKTGAAARTRQKAGSLFGEIMESSCCPAGSECRP